MAIDVGYDYSGSGTGDNGTTTTVLDITNAANATGTITGARFYPNSSGVTGLKVGTFYVVSGITTCTNRGSATLGDFVGGAEQTVTGLSFSVTTGDYAGWYASVGAIRYEKVEGTRYYKLGDQFGQSNIEYGSIGAALDLLYLTGTETAAGQPFIKRFGGVPYAALNRGVF